MGLEGLPLDGGSGDAGSGEHADLRHPPSLTFEGEGHEEGEYDRLAHALRPGPPADLCKPLAGISPRLRNPCHPGISTRIPSNEGAEGRLGLPLLDRHVLLPREMEADSRGAQGSAQGLGVSSSPSLREAMGFTLQGLEWRTRACQENQGEKAKDHGEFPGG
jgi:hypothetical protein